MSDLTEIFAAVAGCCLHEPQWKPEDVDKEIAWVGDRNTGPESKSIVIVRLNREPGRITPGADYGLLTQWEDYTGHGCRCDSMAIREPTLSKLLTHLDDYELQKLIQR